MPRDKDIDLTVAAKHLGLWPKADIVFPPNYSPAYGYPVDILNELYNAADQYVSTALGEGWGLCQTESMAAGTPIIVPDNTSSPEIVGENDERGFMYKCNDQSYVDNRDV
jgi:glycosyltransferase involved in cell wall biosynthesis